MLRLLAIAFVWLGCAVAWVILGSTLVARTNSVSDALDSEVHALWGPPGRQYPPSGGYSVVETVKERVTTTNAAGVASQQTVEKQSRVLFVGWRFALVEIGLAQLVYLVLFSLTFFWEGYTGLAITIGAVVTLFLVMQLTGRFDFRTVKLRQPALP